MGQQPAAGAGTVANLLRILTLLQKNAITVGLAVATVMVVVYTIRIMFDHDSSPTARTARWDGLYRVLICAGIIAGAGALITYASALGNLLNG